MAMRHDAGFAAGAITQRVRDLVTEMGGAQVGHRRASSTSTRA